MKTDPMVFLIEKVRVGLPHKLLLGAALYDNVGTSTVLPIQ